ncbi:MAG TPA: uracil-DNA glycosylase family protein [Verrucomicrobiota bacterium]|nr:uracil-DNA glycosylase family protein [Verrucomicrobiota bacterium]HNU50564.1 uracil-DNA glycosylase family protein [Verrucomicrobiota bacterium]
MERTLQRLLESVRQCAACAPRLPFPPRPVLRVSATARLLIVGQAPGRRVHETGIPWNDPSGDRLRAWLHLDRATFYDTARIAIVPTGLCYPGSGARGDLPPRPECAPLWHPPLLKSMPRLRLILLVGTHAQAYYLGSRRKPTLADTVQAFADYLPRFFPLPHPSPRNHRWFQTHPWLETTVLPAARTLVHNVLAL